MNKTLTFLLSLGLLLILFWQNSFSQKPPVEWGEIPRADLEMKSFPDDSDASALILCDYGESYFNDNLDIEFKHLIRIKIFNSKGYDRATRSIVLFTEDNEESVYDIEGVTYVLNDKNEVEKNVLNKNDIFEENVDDRHKRYRFTMPGLQPGCIVEMRYKIESHSLWSMKNWYFQGSEPVRWSEYRVRVPNTIGYAAVTSGYEPFTINDLEETTQHFNYPAASYLSTNIAKCNQFRWAVEKIPALREEPFTTTLDDYLTKVDLQLAGYALADMGVKRILNDWPTLINRMLESKSFYEMIDDTRKVTKLTEEITKDKNTPEEKMIAIYNWVSKSIVCTGPDRVFGDNDVNDVLEAKSGSDAEISFLLMSMLKSIEIPSDPVILSTRSNGKIQTSYPIISQFNYVITRVKIGDQTYFLDATSPNRPYDLLPVKVLRCRGLVIKEGSKEEWVSVSCPKRRLNTSLANLSINQDGSLTGNIETSFGEYGSLIARNIVTNNDTIDLVKQVVNVDKEGITVESVTVKNKDSVDAPLKFSAVISSPSFAQANGDMIYFNPHILQQIDENPFKAKRRKFPIDYAYKISSSALVKIMIPDSFEVKEKLKELVFSAASNAVTFSRFCEADDSCITISYKYEIKEAEIKPQYYDQIKQFYSRIIAAESEQIVLGKIKEIKLPEEKSNLEEKKSTVDNKNEKNKS